MDKQYSTKIQFLLFIIVGVANTVNGILFATLFSLFLPVKGAFVLGYIVSLCISYLLNTTIVFKKGINFSRFIKFCLSYIPNFIVQFIVVAIVTHYFDFPHIIVYAIAAAIGVPITFLLVKVVALK